MALFSDRIPDEAEKRIIDSLDGDELFIIRTDDALVNGTEYLDPGISDNFKFSFLSPSTHVSQIDDVFEEIGNEFRYLYLAPDDAVQDNLPAFYERVSPADLTGLGIHGYAPSGHSRRTPRDVSFLENSGVLEVYNERDRLERFYNEISDSEYFDMVHVNVDLSGEYDLTAAETAMDARLEIGEENLTFQDSTGKTWTYEL